MVIRRVVMYYIAGLPIHLVQELNVGIVVWSGLEVAMAHPDKSFHEKELFRQAKNSMKNLSAVGALVRWDQWAARLS